MVLPKPRLLQIGALALSIIAFGFLAWTARNGSDSSQSPSSDSSSRANSNRQKTEPDDLGIQKLAERYLQLQRGDGLAPSRDRSVSFRDGNEESFDLLSFTDLTGAVVRISSRSDADFSGTFDIAGFLKQLSKDGQGVRLLKPAPRPSVPSDELQQLLESAKMGLEHEDEADFFPVEIIDRDGARRAAWLMSLTSGSKVSMIDDGIPAGIDIKDPPMAYRRTWYLFVKSPPGQSPIYYQGWTWED